MRKFILMILNKIISVHLSEKLIQMKGFRNILVHRYGEINDKQAYFFLVDEAADFDEFEREIKKYLRTKP